MNKKIIGLLITGVISFGALPLGGSSVAYASDPVVIAAYPQIEMAQAKIDHTIWSINKNYAGIKNQVTWEGYIKEARALIALIPSSQQLKADELTNKVDSLADTVLAIARMNHVEKSYDVNFHGIKNATQWREYLDIASENIGKMDRTVFEAKYQELLTRYNDIDNKVKTIENEYAKALESVTNLYETAKTSQKIEDANKALEEAKKLGSHDSTTDIINKIETLIKEINNKEEENTGGEDENNNQDDSPVKFKELGTVTYKNSRITLADVMTVIPSGNDAIIEGIRLNKPVGSKIRLSNDSNTLNVLYLDENANGAYDTNEDTELGTIKVEVTGDLTLPTSIPYFVDEILTTPSTRAEGTVIVKVEKPDGSTIAATSFEVNITD